MKNQRTMLLATAAIMIVQLMAACGGLSNKQKSAASEAVKSLKKIEAATQVGVNYQQYGMLVIDAKDKFNEASSVLPNGELKKELNAAMEAYADAVQAWSVKFDDIYTLLHTNMEPGKTLIPKYSLKTEKAVSSRSGDYVSPDAALQVIWSTARPHVDRAASLLGQ